MPTIPGEHERALSEFNQKHSSIYCRLGIIRNAGLRTTPGGDVMIDASRQVEATRRMIESDLEEYARMARHLAGISS
jgi:hypothetical protein